jgi:hypothetical protein
MGERERERALLGAALLDDEMRGCSSPTHALTTSEARQRTRAGRMRRGSKGATESRHEPE